jgi:uncharacterized repeat protein (TIGR04138 family)
VEDPGDTLEKLAKRNPKYPADAYRLVFEGLQFFMQSLEERRHASARELYTSMAVASVAHWGLLGGAVAEYFGITNASQVRELVEILIGAKLLTQSEDDDMSDFDAIKTPFSCVANQAWEQHTKANPITIHVCDHEH